MNSLERLLATINGQSVDRVPVFAVLGTWGARLIAADPRRCYSDADTYVASQQAVVDALDPDMILSPFDFSAIGEAFGGEVVWFPNAVPNLRRPAVSSVQHLFDLTLPSPEKTARLPLFLEATKRLTGRFCGEKPVFAVLPGPGILPALAMGLERWIETLLTDPETADRAIRFTQPFIFSWASALQKAGVTGLVITEPLATSEMLPRTMFESMILPRLHDCFSQMEGPLVLHHTGGSIGHVLDLLPGLPHLAGVSVGCRDDLVKARRSLGPDLLLLGNLDNILFAGPAVAEIRARSLECLRTAAPAGRFILCNSGGDIPWSCPQENLQAMIDATVDYAREAGGG